MWGGPQRGLVFLNNNQRRWNTDLNGCDGFSRIFNNHDVISFFSIYQKNAEAQHHQQHHGSRDEEGTDEAGCEGLVVGVMAADGGCGRGCGYINHLASSGVSYTRHYLGPFVFTLRGGRRSAGQQ